jgi:hypothetical protein
MTMVARAFGWFVLAEHIGKRLTMPPTDIRASDRECGQLLMDSALWSSGERLARRAHAAWQDSLLRRWTQAASSGWTQSNPVHLRRAVGWMMTVSGATALLLQAIASPREPFVWILPAGVAAAGVVLSGTAGRRTLPSTRRVVVERSPDRKTRPGR